MEGGLACPKKEYHNTMIILFHHSISEVLLQALPRLQQGNKIP